MPSSSMSSRHTDRIEIGLEQTSHGAGCTGQMSGAHPRHELSQIVAPVRLPHAAGPPARFIVVQETHVRPIGRDEDMPRQEVAVNEAGSMQVCNSPADHSKRLVDDVPA